MRKRATAATIAIGALVLLIPGPAQAAPKTTVTLGDSFFAPSSKTIARGTTVRFKWIGRKRHNVKKTRGPGAGFKSRTTRARGVNYAKRFTKRGTYRMICTIHPETMRLKLAVR
jgi:plastocyanin